MFYSKIKKIIVIAIALVSIAILFQLPKLFTTRDSWAKGKQVRYDYLHFTAGSCGERRPIGKGVIDLRNGNVWCVPYDGSAPTLEGTLNLSAITDK